MNHPLWIASSVEHLDLDDALLPDDEIGVDASMDPLHQVCYLPVL